MCDVYPGNGGDGGRSWVQIRPICSVISQLLVTCSSPYPLYLVLDAKKGVQLHLQTAMRIHFENACRVFKETNSKLEEKVSALELKQAEIDQEKSTLQKQVQELKSANAALEARLTAQENFVGIKKRKICEEDNEFQRHLKKCQEWVWQRDIQFSIRNW